MSDALFASAKLSLIRISDENDGNVECNDETEGKYSKMVQRHIDLVLSSIKATKGKTNHPVFVGFLDRLVASLIGEYGSESSETCSSAVTLYHASLFRVMRYSVSDRGWRTVLTKPANITCKIMIQHGQYHLGIYDASGSPVLAGYVVAKQKDTDEFDIKDIRDRSVKFPIQNQAQSERSGHVPGGTMQSWCLTLRDEAERVIFKTAYTHASEHNALVNEQKIVKPSGASSSSSSSSSSQNDTEDGGTETDAVSDDNLEVDIADIKPPRGISFAAAKDCSSDASAYDATSDSASDDLASLPETQDIFSQNRYFP